VTPQAFVALLVAAHQKSAELVREHYADYDDLLIHLLMADVLRLCVSEFAAGNRALSDRLLEMVNTALRQGDPRLVNAVLVSFVEHAGYGEGEPPEFLATWPDDLLAALNSFE
jgi:hypothetical protein